jgi:hypothetical protein
MSRPRNPKKPPTFGTPVKPAHLSPGASAEWDRLLSEIKEAGLQITPAHRARQSCCARKRIS